MSEIGERPETVKNFLNDFCVLKSKGTKSIQCNIYIITNTATGILIMLM